MSRIPSAHDRAIDLNCINIPSFDPHIGSPTRWLRHDRLNRWLLNDHRLLNDNGLLNDRLRDHDGRRGVARRTPSIAGKASDNPAEEARPEVAAASALPTATAPMMRRRMMPPRSPARPARPWPPSTGATRTTTMRPRPNGSRAKQNSHDDQYSLHSSIPFYYIDKAITCSRIPKQRKSHSAIVKFINVRSADQAGPLCHPVF